MQQALVFFDLLQQVFPILASLGAIEIDARGAAVQPRYRRISAGLVVVFHPCQMAAAFVAQPMPEQTNSVFDSTRSSLGRGRTRVH
jgi:hypothetical protein